MFERFLAPLFVSSIILSDTLAESARLQGLQRAFQNKMRLYGAPYWREPRVVPAF